jgi:hypothetical protein
LNSKHRHGTNKAVKVGMSKKTGLRKGTDLIEQIKQDQAENPILFLIFAYHNHIVSAIAGFLTGVPENPERL